jgi:hypothetical protein
MQAPDIVKTQGKFHWRVINTALLIVCNIEEIPRFILSDDSSGGKQCFAFQACSPPWSSELISSYVSTGLCREPNAT